MSRATTIRNARRTHCATGGRFPTELADSAGGSRDIFGMATEYISVMTGQQFRPDRGKSMRTPVDLSESAKPAASANDYELLAKHGEEGLR
jgi:hypothetical protein